MFGNPTPEHKTEHAGSVDLVSFYQNAGIDVEHYQPAQVEFINDYFLKPRLYPISLANPGVPPDFTYKVSKSILGQNVKNLLDVFNHTSETDQMYPTKLGIMNEVVAGTLLRDMAAKTKSTFLTAPAGLDSSGLGANGDIVWVEPANSYSGGTQILTQQHVYNPLALIDLKFIGNAERARKTMMGKSIYADDLKAPVLILNTGLYNEFSGEPSDNYTQLMGRIVSGLRQGTPVDLHNLPEKPRVESLLKEKLIRELVRVSFNTRNVSQLDVNRRFSDPVVEKLVNDRLLYYKSKILTMSALLGVSSYEMQQKQDDFTFKSVRESQPRPFFKFA